MSEIELHNKAMKSSKLSKKNKHKFLPLTHQGRSYRGDLTVSQKTVRLYCKL